MLLVPQTHLPPPIRLSARPMHTICMHVQCLPYACTSNAYHLHARPMPTICTWVHMYHAGMDPRQVRGVRRIYTPTACFSTTALRSSRASHALRVKRTLRAGGSISGRRERCTPHPGHPAMSLCARAPTRTPRRVTIHLYDLLVDPRAHPAARGSVVCSLMGRGPACRLRCV